MRTKHSKKLTKVQRFEYIQDRVEFPMIFVTMLLLGIIIVRESFELNPLLHQVFYFADLSIWVIFVVEIIGLTYLAPDPGKYLKEHWYDVLIVFLPFLRILRLLRLDFLKYLEGAILYIFKILAILFGSDAQLVRVFPLLARGIGAVRSLFKKHRLDFIIYVILALIVFLGSLGAVFEKDAPGANITSILDGIWWSVVSISTVGYGDYYPVTIQGRIIGVILITIGVVLFSLLTANIASNIMGEQDNKERKLLKKELDLIESKLELMDLELHNIEESTNAKK